MLVQRDWFRICSIIVIGLFLSGCASSNRPSKKNSELIDVPEWQGRLSVNVQSDPPSSMTAAFSLRGDAQRGELDLYSPIGTTLGALEWSPNIAQLNQGGAYQRFDSFDELTQKTTGAELPLSAIFGWLNGKDIDAIGWQADLSNLSNGSLSARRTSPLPEVSLRIKLD